VVRSGNAAAGVQALAEAQVGGVVTALARAPLVAWPAEVLGRGVAGVDRPVDLLGRVPSHVPHPDVPGARTHREAERVSQAEGHEATGLGVGARGERIAGQSRPGERVDAQERAVKGLGVGRGEPVLAAERPSLAGGRRLGAAHAHRGVAARVLGDPHLAVVDEVGAGRVSAGHVQRAVRAELDVSDRVGGRLLAPVLDQDLLRAARRVALRGQVGQPAARHAPVGGGPGRRGAAVVPGRCGAADRSVVGVEDVDVRLGREIGMDRES